MDNNIVTTAKINDNTIVILLRFFSIILVLVNEDIAPPKASDRPPPFPECSRTKTIKAIQTIICIVKSKIKYHLSNNY
jgi:hypothetical protein